MAALVLGCGSEPARPQPQHGNFDPRAAGSGELWAYNRQGGALERCRPGSVGPAERPLVFVHGLLGAKNSFRAFLTFLARQPQLRDRPLLAFAYPGAGGLGRCGRGLREEMSRVVAAPGRATFICHSAGGLVFRHYAEVLGGEFDRAVLLGAPNRGSSLAELDAVLGAADLVAGLRHLLPEKAAARLPGLLDEMLPDVRPGGAFLSRLGEGPATAARYHAVGGTCLSRPSSLALGASLFAARSFLRTQAQRIPSPVLRQTALRRLDGLRVPPEVTRGDLLVTADSACLPGAGRVTRLRASHRALRADERVMRQVLRAVLDETPP